MKMTSFILPYNPLTTVAITSCSSAHGESTCLDQLMCNSVGFSIINVQGSRLPNHTSYNRAGLVSMNGRPPARTGSDKIASGRKFHLMTNPVMRLSWTGKTPWRISSRPDSHRTLLEVILGFLSGLLNSNPHHRSC